ncbi:MAG: hypothetical protein A3F84_10225 [Candidatus Handelsmanbacteria bacterium RIFCSPLOWO2_12_FULL_64_10]|uniref:Addiction module protein n=1 Tax=Handelsmanbacteria sp. (strain RIFCSPLOWO2_12_FULL_64_10) TaxID=1817868 RepID=A0A1F6D495_HANXR|nr:MAG: hypothetical protein A3F84_10225 [Candidatus Handelsmanbacteria bacterium RIFCSPLOWO2_12_FULL_64_10]
MSNRTTLEQLKQQVAQLPPDEQLKLAGEIHERLDASITPAAENDREQAQRERLTQVDAWIAECEKVAKLWKGEFDSAADLRRIRDEEA